MRRIKSDAKLLAAEQSKHARPSPNETDSDGSVAAAKAAHTTVDMSTGESKAVHGGFNPGEGLPKTKGAVEMV
jgi:hypothetical protein